MTNDSSGKYDVLRSLVQAGARREEPHPVFEAALRQTLDVLNIQAAAVYIFADDREAASEIAVADSDQHRERLATLEEGLFAALRRDKQLVSGYLSFGGTPPIHTFTMPLRRGNHVFGAVLGLQEGQRTIVSEDDFIETFASALSLNAIVADLAGGEQPSTDALHKERLAAIVETAVTVNHEINNPLTAILGNVQLLLMKEDSLPEDLRKKLRTVEESALKIRSVTQRLLRITDARSVQYVQGTNMIELPSEDDSEPSD